MVSKIKGVFFIFIIFSLILATLSFFLMKKKAKEDSNTYTEARYLAFGDSITHGNWLEDSYPELVAEELGCK